jgi:hypothetical protein
MTKALPFDVMWDALSAARRFGHFKTVCFTGGECFLLGTRLRDLVRHAAEAGFVTRCMTNSYWAVNEKGARARLDPLVEAGLREIVISTGYFHQKYVPVDRIWTGALTACEYGLKTSVMIEETKEHLGEFHEFMRKPEIRAAIEAQRLQVFRSPWIAMGGEAPIDHQRGFHRLREDRMASCRIVLRTIAVTPDADVVACCGLPLEKIPELRLGSLHEKPLDAVLREHVDDPLKIWLHVEGPERMYQFAKAKDDGITLPDLTVHQCQTCSLLHGDKRAMDALRRHGPERAQRIQARYFAQLVGRTRRIHEKIGYALRVALLVIARRLGRPAPGIRG